MLLNDLYKIISISNTEMHFIHSVHLDKNHPIFKGHFPQQPVLPGACMMQMIRELSEIAIAKKLLFKAASGIKFLSVIDPHIHLEADVEIQISISGNVIKTDSVIKKDATLFFKMKAEYEIAEQ